MRRDEFADGQRAQASGNAPQFEGEAQPQEILVLGDWAVLWTKLRVEGGGKTRAGYTLSLMKKEGGRWKIARDANLLAPSGNEPGQAISTSK
jgi:ketosteroid isomerase-like protein